MKKILPSCTYFFVEGLNDVGQNHRSTMQMNNGRGPIPSYPGELNKHGQFSNHQTVALSKGGVATRMYQDQNKVTKQQDCSVFQPGQLVSSPQSSIAHHQQMNNNNSHNHQPHLNHAPWSNGSAGSSGMIILKYYKFTSNNSLN